MSVTLPVRFSSWWKERRDKLEKALNQAGYRLELNRYFAGPDTLFVYKKAWHGFGLAICQLTFDEATTYIWIRTGDDDTVRQLSTLIAESTGLNVVVK